MMKNKQLRKEKDRGIEGRDGERERDQGRDGERETDQGRDGERRIEGGRDQGRDGGRSRKGERWRERKRTERDKEMREEEGAYQVSHDVMVSFHMLPHTDHLEEN